MTLEQHNEIITELRAIRAALETKPRAVATAPSTSTSNATSLPPPDQIIEGAASVTVHFGKNKGVAIGSLTEKQILWYGADREPQLKNDGTPFAPREQDVTLKNSCRTVWHQRQGSIPASAPKPAPAQSAELADEEVPF